VTTDRDPSHREAPGETPFRRTARVTAKARTRTVRHLH
jgi:hypothetical protein